MYHIQIKKKHIFGGVTITLELKTPSDFQAYISPVFFKHRALSIKTKLFQRIGKYHFSSLYDRFHWFKMVSSRMPCKIYHSA